MVMLTSVPRMVEELNNLSLCGAEKIFHPDYFNYIISAKSLQRTISLLTEHVLTTVVSWQLILFGKHTGIVDSAISTNILESPG